MKRRQQRSALEVAKRLLLWFERNGRKFVWRSGRLTDWQILVTEILLQKTPSHRVALVLPDLFKAFPEPRDVARAALSDLENLFRPLGLQRIRARSLKALAQIVNSCGSVPTDLDTLQTLPGVGPYVASAFLVVTRNQKFATIDANVVRLIRRVFTRHPNQKTPLSTAEGKIAATLIEASDDARKVNWAMLDYGALVCTPRKPRCWQCDLENLCRYRSKVRDVRQRGFVSIAKSEPSPIAGNKLIGV
jgi:A/G-specific adenine glycosylase